MSDDEYDGDNFNDGDDVADEYVFPLYCMPIVTRHLVVGLLVLCPGHWTVTV
jgi:hypothetical protein